jgi:hypothetical protein
VLIQVTIYETGNYIFSSISDIDTYGCFYNGTFDPFDPLLNLAVSNDDGGGTAQFQFTVFLTADSTYYIVVTTFSENVFGEFTLSVNGSATVGLSSEQGE